MLFTAVIRALGEEKGAAWLKWMEEEWPSWARRTARRLEDGRGDCP